MNYRIYLANLVIYVLSTIWAAEASDTTFRRGVHGMMMPDEHVNRELGECFSPDTIPVIDIFWGFNDRSVDEFKVFSEQMLKGYITLLVQRVREYFPYTRLGVYKFEDYQVTKPVFSLVSPLTDDLESVDEIMRRQVIGFGGESPEQLLHGVWTCAALQDIGWQTEHSRLIGKNTVHYRFILVSTDDTSTYPVRLDCGDGFNNFIDREFEVKVSEGCGPSYYQLGEHLNYHDIKLFFLPTNSRVSYYNSVLEDLVSRGYEKRGEVIELDLKNPDLVIERIVHRIRHHVCPITRPLPPPRIEHPIEKYPTIQYPTIQPPTAQHPTIQYPTIQPPTAQHPPIQHPIGEHSTIQHPSIEHPIIRPPFPDNSSTSVPPNRPPTNDSIHFPPTNDTIHSPPMNGSAHSPPMNGSAHSPPMNGSADSPPSMLPNSSNSTPINALFENRKRESRRQ